ncbi:MAG: iron-sulfur cluster assembly scaffold protein [Planctomycetota bacterium]
MAWEYSEKTVKLFMDAVQGKPGTHLGEIKDPDGFGEHGSIICGDALRFTFRVEKDATNPAKDKIVEARYLTFGCTSAIASSEALCSLIEEGGYTPIQALKVKNKDIVDYLDGLPDQKLHCSVMGAEALEAAVIDWAKKRGFPVKELGLGDRPEEQEEGRIVCQCFSISEPFLKRKIKEMNLRSIEEITNAIKAGGGCSSCHHAPGGLQDTLNEVWGQESVPGSGLGSTAQAHAEKDVALSPYQFSKKVESTVNQMIRPMLKNDGGDLEIVDIKENRIYCKLKGACSGCAGASQTLKNSVERTLREHVDENIRVIAV